MKKLLCLLICVCALVCALPGAGAERTVYASISDLKNARIGVLTGTNMDRVAAETLGEDCVLVYLNSTEDMIPALTAGKVDCFLGDEPWIRYMSSSTEGVTYIDERFVSEEYAVVFRKTAAGAALRDEFNTFLSGYTEQELTELQNSWFNSSPDEYPVFDLSALKNENGTLKVCTEALDPPFVFVYNDRFTGYEIELVYRFCETYGYGLVIDDMTFPSLLPAIASGKYDVAACSFAITPEREESVYFSSPVYHAGPVAAIRTENSVQGENEAENRGLLSGIGLSFQKTFVREARWKLFARGIGVTLLITVLSLLAGTALSFCLYMLYRRGNKAVNYSFALLSRLITGLPEVLFLLILYYVVFASSELSGMWVSVIAFTVIVTNNVLEMLKAGVGSIDPNQTEAALALGYTENGAFFRIVLPQALKFILPLYTANIVTLLKSTSIVGYLSVHDLTRVSDIVRSRTFEAFFPLMVTAALYFVIARLLITAVSHLQSRLLPVRKNKKQLMRKYGIDIGGKNA